MNLYCNIVQPSVLDVTKYAIHCVCAFAMRYILCYIQLARDLRSSFGIEKHRLGRGRHYQQHFIHVQLSPVFFALCTVTADAPAVVCLCVFCVVCVHSHSRFRRTNIAKCVIPTARAFMCCLSSPVLCICLCASYQSLPICLSIMQFEIINMDSALDSSARLHNQQITHRQT